MQPRRAVITGLGCITPFGAGVPAYAEALLHGRSGVARIASFDPTRLPVRIAAEARGFDQSTVVAEKDAKHVPRVTALALAAATEALVDAGLAEGLSLEERRRFAVVLGTGGAAAEFMERQYVHFFQGDLRKASVYAVPSSTPGTIASELSMRFRLHGPSQVISTGCTSSTDAIGLAMRMIRWGDADRVLVGGSDATITPAMMDGFCLMGILSSRWNEEPSRASRPFSADRDGFVLGEGAWVAVLEAEDVARGRVRAEVAGYGATCDAYHRVRLEESGEEPSRAMALATADAGIAPGDVQYLNLHGTSTVLNDRIETRAVKLFLGDRARRVPMSSTKSMIGHPQGACGAAGLVATVIGMERGWIPPTINLEKPDPECDLDYVAEGARRTAVDVALVNTIGFGSKNAALVVRRRS